MSANQDIPFGLADFNGDGKADALSSFDDHMQFIPAYPEAGDGMGGFTRANKLGILALILPQFGDLDRDGKTDLFVLSGGDLYALLENGDCTFGQPIIFRNTVAPRSYRLADLNGDNKLDVVLAGFDGNMNPPAPAPCRARRTPRKRWCALPPASHDG